MENKLNVRRFINGLISDVSLQANMPNMSPFHIFFYLQITFGLITAVGHANKKEKSL